MSSISALSASTASVASLFKKHSHSSRAKSSGSSSGINFNTKSSSFRAIQSAVTTALQKSESTGSSEDPNQVIESALAKIFKSGIASPTEATTNDASSASTATTATDNAQQTFLQVLQQFGVTPQQFQTDFQTAAQDAQTTSSSTTTANQNGSLDLYA